MRETGILMPVSSLPSRTGVGELGKETYTFLDILKEAGVKIIAKAGFFSADRTIEEYNRDIWKLA